MDMAVDDWRDAKSRLQAALKDAGFSRIQAYGLNDDPVVDAGVVPPETMWNCYREAMEGHVPCFSCFENGTGEECLSGSCPGPVTKFGGGDVHHGVGLSEAAQDLLGGHSLGSGSRLDSPKGDPSHA